MASQLELAQQRLTNLHQQRDELLARRKELSRPGGPEQVPEIPRNASREQVMEVQRWLMSHGYYDNVPKGTNPIDGSPQGATAAALAKAQADTRTKAGDVRDYETRKSAVDDKIKAIGDDIKIAEKDVHGSTWGGWTENAAQSFGPRVAGVGLGVGENRMLAKGLDAVAAGRANNLISVAGDLKDIDYRSPAALAQAEGRVAAARPYLTPTNPTMNALSRAGGVGGRLGIYSVLPALEGAEYFAYDKAANDSRASEAERANNRMIANGLITSAATGGLLGVHSALTPNVPDTGAAQAQIRTAEAMLRNRQGGTLPGPINPTGFTPEQPTPTNALLRSPDAIDVMPQPSPQQPVTAEQLVERDPRFRNYLADQEQILRGQTAARRAVPSVMPLGASQAVAAQEPPVANALLAQPQAPAPQPMPPESPMEARTSPLSPAGTTPAEPAIPPAAGSDIASLQARLQAAQDPAEIEALKRQIAELQGALDAQAAKQAASREKAGISTAMTYGGRRLEEGSASDAIPRARAIDPEANWLGAKDVLARENQRIGGLSANALKAELEAAGVASEGLSRGRMMTALMRAKTFGVPAAIATGAGALALGAGGNMADAAPQGQDEGTAHYIARRAYPAVASAANAGSYLAPVIGSARLGADVLNVGMNTADALSTPGSVMPADNAQQTLSGNLAAGRQYGLSNVPPLPPMEYADPRLPDPREAQHAMLVQRLAEAREQDLRQRYGSRPEAGAAPPSSFDAALARLTQAIMAHRQLLDAQSQPAPANALLRP